MRVFNLNKAMGFASSGVEYAQAYRRRVLAGIAGVDDYYVFTDHMPTNPCVFADRLGLTRPRVLWLYHLLSGRILRPCTVSVERMLARIVGERTVTRPSADCTDVTLEHTRVRYRLRHYPGPFVDRVETFVEDELREVAHYDATLHTVEHFRAGTLRRRTCYTPDGRVAAEQFCHGNEILRTVLTPASPLHGGSARGGDIVLEGRAGLFRFVFARLFDREDDVVIVDRALDVIDAVYPVIGRRRLFSVVHAEHYDLKQHRDGVLLWNNHYEHVFSRAELLHGLIVSTERQRDVLSEQLRAEAQRRGLPEARLPQVVCIPVGSASGLGNEWDSDSASASSEDAASEDAASEDAAVRRGAAPTPRMRRAGYEPDAIVTASRLADEKHVDILIRAVAIARAQVPRLRLDIYGEGNRDGILAARRDSGTEDCVRLMGHRSLGGILGRYALYVTASWSEGFGLSLLEAMSAGLPIVGFDVEYGNRELVEPGVNGLLVPHTSEDADADALAAAIVRVLGSPELDELGRQSARRAEGFATPQIAQRWAELLQGTPC